jgi:hypothetical protein
LGLVGACYAASPSGHGQKGVQEHPARQKAPFKFVAGGINSASTDPEAGNEKFGWWPPGDTATTEAASALFCEWIKLRLRQKNAPLDRHLWNVG